jgi:dCTP deaminase
MILKAEDIYRELTSPKDINDPLVITPMLDLDGIKNSGAASVDMRLGCWFLTFRQSRIGVFDVYEKHADIPSEAKLTKSHYVPFGVEFVIHPKSFVLGVTLEWLRLPSDKAAYVIGRSSWGRHGLIIATATGVHPGFTGCITLELSNVGEVPIIVKPGTTICQLFIHEVHTGDPTKIDRSSFFGRRKPTLGTIELDKTALKLSTGLT